MVIDVCIGWYVPVCRNFWTVLHTRFQIWTSILTKMRLGIS